VHQINRNAPSNLSAKSQKNDALSLALEPSNVGNNEFDIASVSPQTLRDAKDAAKRFVFNALGNSGTALCMALEHADTLRGFLDTAKISRDTLRNMRGDGTARAFDQQLREILTR
jgi:hypothetical protein